MSTALLNICHPPKMDPTIKEKWVAALRSDKYKQTTCRLRNSQGMCCLGVLCDVVDPSGWASQEDTDDMKYCVGDNWDTQMPPIELYEQVGVGGNLATKLATANDCSGWTFEQIAEWIEKNL